MANRTEYMRIYRKEHPEYVERQRILSNKINRDKWKNNPTYKKERIEQNKAHRQKIRKEIIGLLGNKCSNPNCPIPPDKMDFRALQIDHVNGNGRADIKKYKKNIAQIQLKIYKEIKEGSKEYQCLCAYCNWIKRYENGECN